MSFKNVSLRILQPVAGVVLLAVLSALAITNFSHASPGAHGPNGEHLDTTEKAQASANPKFESFTESFELIGEVLENQLVIYLHDFKSNTPVINASIELESDEHSASAEYSSELAAYSVKNPDLLKKLKTAGEHEIVLTVLTPENGDLLVSHLVNSQPSSDKLHEEEHHHHYFSWLELLLWLFVFVVGFYIGRLTKESKK